MNTGVRGTVKDATQSVIPNATVQLNSNVAPTQETTTDAQGQYSFTGLRAGTYSVIVSLVGFETFQGGQFALIVGQSIEQDVTLSPAGTKTVTEVSGDAPRVETSDPSVYNTLNTKELTGYQLNGRNFIQLIALTPGVSNQTGQDEASVGVQGSAAFSVNGGRTEYNSFDLDGSDLLNVGFNGAVNTLIVYPSLDAIGEMKILTSNYGAMYGRTASGTVLVSTKSGTTEFHGNLYYFNRNEAFNARNFFDETKGAPLYRRHDLGGTVGGPLYIPGVYNTKKDKTFFFFSEEYRNEKTPYQFNQGVPSAAERNGDFSDVCPSASQFYTAADGSKNFFRTPPAPGVKTYPDCPGLAATASPTISGQVVSTPWFRPYSYSTASGATVYNHIFDPNGNQFPNRNATAILGTGIIPVPNSTAGCNSSINSCYDASISVPTHWREDLFRLDQYFNDKNRLMFRFIHDDWNTVTPTPQYGIITNNLPTIQNDFTGPGTSAVLRFSQAVSPSLLNEAFFSYINSKITLTNRNGPNVTWQRPSVLDTPCSSHSNPPNVECGLGYLFNNGFGGKMPGLQFLGNAAYGGGFSVDGAYMPWTHTNPVYTFGDTITKQWGNHFLQGGAEFSLYYRDQTNSVSGAATGDMQGILTYSNRSAYSGNAFANFLMEAANGGDPQLLRSGTVDSFQQDSAQDLYYQRYAIAEPYLQDDWKIRPHLTLNLGLRLSLFGTYHERDNNVYNWESGAFNPVLASQIGIDTILTGALQIPPPNGIGQGTLLAFNPGSPDPHLLNGLVRCGYNGVAPGCMSGHVLNPAPRVGFGWDPSGSGKTSIRGGYGIFFEHGTGNEANTGSLEGSAPQVLNMTTTYVRDLSCIGTSNPTVCGLPPGVGPGQILAFPLNVTSIQTKTQWPYVQQWSFSVQRELPDQTVATIAYVGSKGTHLTAETQTNSINAVPASQNPFGPHEPFIPGTVGTTLNVLTGGDCTQEVDSSGRNFYSLLSGNDVYQGTPAYNNLSTACSYAIPINSGPLINSLRPYRGIGQIVTLNNVATSSYNALQVTARRTTGPLTLGFSYTWSHSLDDSSDRFDPVPNAFDLGSNWASSNFDERHLLNVSYIYDIPVPDSWKRSSLLRNAIGGWQWSGITVLQSGIPFSVINSPSSSISTADNAGVANGIGVSSIQSYPDLVGNPHSKPPANGNNGTTIGPLLLNPNAFVVPRGLTFGTAGRNSVNNPYRWNFDMSLFKDFKIREGQLLQFRAEAFNVFNNTQFEIYNPAKRNQANNTITCYGDSATGYSAGADVCLAGNAFLHPIDAHRPRTLQLALKFTF